MFVKMKIKCFSKRKLNVRISKTKIKCAILGFSQNCCILGKSREKLVKFSKNSAKIQQILVNFATFCKNQQKNSAIFNEKIEIRERCKGAVNSTKRKPGSVIISQVYSQACHTAVILDRARGLHWVERCSCL